MTTIEWLQHWFHSYCNGDWEHDEGIQLQTLDNPGWTLTVNLESTSLENRPFLRIQHDRNEDDWVRCWVESHRFEGRCGPCNLVELLEMFRTWAESEDVHRVKPSTDSER